MMRPLFATALSMCLVACSLTENHDCPDFTRLKSIDIPNDYLSSVNKVDDCLAEYGTKLAQGNSSDQDAATANVSYCGQYQFNAGLSDEDLRVDRGKEIAEALRVIVAARTFKCPAPRHRDIGKDLDGNPEPVTRAPDTSAWGAATAAETN